MGQGYFEWPCGWRRTLASPFNILVSTLFPRPLHKVESEESTNLAKLRALFPDYHSGFKDLSIHSSDVADDDEDAEDGGDKHDRTQEGTGDVDARIKALGHMSDKQLSTVVARHCRIFLSLSARRRRAVRALLGSSSSSSRRDGSSLSSDAERLVAFEDSYRASVLLADPTSRLSSSVVLQNATQADLEPGSVDGVLGPRVLQAEEVFSASHLLALADAARLCRSGRSLLEDAVGLSVDDAIPTGAAFSRKAKGSKKTKAVTGFAVSTAPWRGEGAAGRNLLLVDPLVNFHLDSNVGETRLADGPLAAVLRRVAGLLEEFPGHGVLIQVSFILKVR